MNLEELFKFLGLAKKTVKIICLVIFLMFIFYSG